MKFSKFYHEPAPGIYEAYVFEFSCGCSGIWRPEGTRTAFFCLEHGKQYQAMLDAQKAHAKAGITVE